jgi:hemolysin activation/secretion protein
LTLPDRTEIRYDHIVAWHLEENRFYKLQRSGTQLGRLQCVNDRLEVATARGSVDITNDAILGQWHPAELQGLMVSVTAKNGSIIQGRFVHFDAHTVTLEAPFAGVMTLPNQEIDRWEATPAQLYVLANGERVRGELRYEKGKPWVVSSEGATNVIRNPVVLTWGGSEQDLNHILMQEQDLGGAPAALPVAPSRKKSFRRSALSGLGKAICHLPLPIVCPGRPEPQPRAAQPPEAARPQAQVVYSADAPVQPLIQPPPAPPAVLPIATPVSPEPTISETNPAPTESTISETSPAPTEARRARRSMLPGLQKLFCRLPLPEAVCPADGNVRPLPPAPEMPFLRLGTPRHNVQIIFVQGAPTVVRDVLRRVDDWANVQLAFQAGPVSDEEIEALRQILVQAGREAGYVLAEVDHVTGDFPQEILTYNVRTGGIGDVQVSGNRHYSEKQIVRNLGLEKGTPFNYTTFREDVKTYSVNSDVKVDVTLDPKTRAGQHEVDVAVKVQDKLPIHGSVEFAHEASGAGSDQRVRTTIEHLNVTKADDQLSAQWTTDPGNIDEINAVSASYRRPIGSKNAVNVYGGWSEADLNDVLPELDIHGTGHFVGIQATRALRKTPRYRIDGAVGVLHQSLENALDLANIIYDEQNVRLTLPGVSLSYADRAFDRLGGRNVASLSLLGNAAGALGSSDEEELRRNMPNADGDFLIAKAEFARLQKLFDTRSSLFCRLNGQFTDATLVPALQKAVGGADELRGYLNREFSADSGLSGTVELRTPLLQDFIPGLAHTPEFRNALPRHWSWHQLQLLSFFDFAYLSRNDGVIGLDSTEAFASAGLGLRLALSPYSALKLDYGMPLNETDASPGSGRGYLSLQLHF